MQEDDSQLNDSIEDVAEINDEVRSVKSHTSFKNLKSNSNDPLSGDDDPLTTKSKHSKRTRLNEAEDANSPLIGVVTTLKSPDGQRKYAGSSVVGLAESIKDGKSEKTDRQPSFKDGKSQKSFARSIKSRKANHAVIAQLTEELAADTKQMINSVQQEVN